MTKVVTLLMVPYSLIIFSQGIIKFGAPTKQWNVEGPAQGGHASTDRFGSDSSWLDSFGMHQTSLGLVPI
ncbi:hypothetical protein Leryth_005640 [Lithospermum erythrorhizon]|uniref:Uncharacterized protein n=1 Tax=Lithospermum erythrorhizon TaxID=34254 RepID=A0AAV3P1Q3_LITER|nr:hypothetical protein Leryth_005640 [Lithospermum erythrorhizon]